MENAEWQEAKSRSKKNQEKKKDNLIVNSTGSRSKTLQKPGEKHGSESVRKHGFKARKSVNVPKKNEDFENVLTATSTPSSTSPEISRRMANLSMDRRKPTTTAFGVKKSNAKEKEVKLITNRVQVISICDKISVFNLSTKEDRKIEIKKIFTDYESLPMLAFDGSKLLVQCGYCGTDPPPQNYNIHGDNYVLQKLLKAKIDVTRVDRSYNGQVEKMLSQEDFQYMKLIMTKNLPDPTIEELNSSKKSSPQSRGSFHSNDGLLELKYQFKIGGGMIQTVSGMQTALDLFGSVVYKKMSLLEFMQKKGYIVKGELQKGMLSSMNATLKGMKLKPNHRAGGSHTFKCFSSNSCGEEKVVIDGESMSVFNYVKGKYGKSKSVRNLNKDWPCVSVSTSSSQLYPIECLDIVEEQKFSGTLSNEQLKNIHLAPQDRLEKIIDATEKFAEKLGRATNGGVNIATELIRVDGKELGTLDVDRKVFIEPRNITNGAILVNVDQKNLDLLDSANMDSLTNCFVKSGKVNKMKIQFCSIYYSWKDLKQKLDKGDRPDFIWVLQSERAKEDLYHEVMMSTMEKDIPTQFTKFENVKNDKKRQGYFRNLILKVNAKLGGINFDSRVPHLAKRTLVLGMDVSHGNLNTEGGRNLPTVATAGLVALLPDENKYSSSFVLQEALPKRSDIMRSESMLKLLQGLKLDATKFDSVLMYRDGVGESLRAELIEKEFSVLKDFFKERPVTMWMANKRNAERFMRIEEEDENGITVGNPNAGTLIDKIVTETHREDFYLQAHKCPLGTARIPHYRLIADESKRDVEKLKRITNHLSASYQRSYGAVSQTCVAYYAHILADRCRSWLVETKQGTVFDDRCLKKLGSPTLYYL